MKIYDKRVSGISVISVIEECEIEISFEIEDTDGTLVTVCFDHIRGEGDNYLTSIKIEGEGKETTVSPVKDVDFWVEVINAIDVIVGGVSEKQNLEEKNAVCVQIFNEIEKVVNDYEIIVKV